MGTLARPRCKMASRWLPVPTSGRTETPVRCFHRRASLPQTSVSTTIAGASTSTREQQRSWRVVRVMAVFPAPGSRKQASCLDEVIT